MRTSRAVTGIEYDPQLIDDATLARWTRLKVPPRLRRMQPEQVTWLTKVMRSAAFRRGEAAEFYDEAAVSAAVREALADVRADPDFAFTSRGAQRGADVQEREILADMKAALLSPTVDERVAQADLQTLQRIELTTDAIGVMECRVDGRLLLRANTRVGDGRTTAIVLQIAIVFLDVVTIVMAAAGIVAEYFKDLAQRFVQFVDGMKGWFMSMMERFWAKLTGLFQQVRVFKSSGESAKWVTVVKDAARDVGKAIAAMVTWAKAHKKWAEWASACKKAVKLMFSTGWAMFKAAVELIASLILLCVTAGSSLVLKIIGLLAALVLLVLHSIDLYDLVHPPA